MNSSCVNAVTGKKGLENARKMAKATDELLRTVSFEFRETKTRTTRRERLSVRRWTGVIG